MRKTQDRTRKSASSTKENGQRNALPQHTCKRKSQRHVQSQAPLRQMSYTQYHLKRRCEYDPTKVECGIEQSTRAQEHKSTRAQEHKSTRAQERRSTRAQEHKSAGAQEHKSTRAQEHINMKRTFRLTSLHCCQPMRPGHDVAIQLNFERKTSALKNVAHHKPIALCARSKGKHEAQDTERRARSIMYNAALP